MSVTIVLADNHQIIRAGLRKLIEDQPDFRVVGEADNGRSAVSLAERLQPNVFILDVALRELNGIDATRQIVHVSPATRIVGLSAYTEQKYIVQMIGAGAAAYLTKDCDAAELALAIHSVQDGKAYLSPDIAMHLVRHFTDSPSASTDSAENLSPREREVLQSLAEGSTIKQIAQKLGLSSKTIETHKRNVMEKLQVYSVAELTRYAIREGVTGL